MNVSELPKLEWFVGTRRRLWSVENETHTQHFASERMNKKIPAQSSSESRWVTFAREWEPPARYQMGEACGRRKSRRRTSLLHACVFNPRVWFIADRARARHNFAKAHEPSECRLRAQIYAHHILTLFPGVAARTKIMSSARGPA